MKSFLVSDIFSTSMGGRRTFVVTMLIKNSYFIKRASQRITYLIFWKRLLLSLHSDNLNYDSFNCCYWNFELHFEVGVYSSHGWRRCDIWLWYGVFIILYFTRALRFIFKLPWSLIIFYGGKNRVGCNTADESRIPYLTLSQILSRILTILKILQQSLQKLSFLSIPKYQEFPISFFISNFSYQGNTKG